MINQLILLGRITEINDEDRIVELAVPRSFKNAEGEYETDYIKCKMYREQFKPVSEFCVLGDIIGIRGRVQGNEGNLEIVAEKVTILQSKKEGDKE